MTAKNTQRFSKPANSAARPSQPKRRRVSSTRVIIWIVELAVLLVFVQYLVINPRLARRRQDERDAAARRQREQELRATEPVPVIGGLARSLPHLTEIPAARFAPLAGLAPGSILAQKTQSFIAIERRLPVEVENSIGMRFRLIPPGTFMMGSPKDEKERWEGESQHVVAIPEPFYIGKYEVTQEQWRQVMGNNPAYFKGDRRPVEGVTWYDCQRFSIALSEMEGLPAGSYRLPTEQEWEYACRARTETAYYFGNDASRLSTFAIYAGNNNQRTATVGSKRPNAYGLYNMHGNVWEWCLDRFKGYKDWSIDSEKAAWRVIRGGNWREPAGTCRSANRARLPPLSHGNILGLRLVRVIPPEPAEEPSLRQPFDKNQQ